MLRWSGLHQNVHCGHNYDQANCSCYQERVVSRFLVGRVCVRVVCVLFVFHGRNCLPSGLNYFCVIAFMRGKARKKASDAMLREIYAKYSAAQASRSKSLLEQKWVADGLLAIAVFFVVFFIGLAFIPVFLGPSDSAIASAFGLRTVVPIASLCVALAVVLAFFQLQFIRKPVV